MAIRCAALVAALFALALIASPPSTAGSTNHASPMVYLLYFRAQDDPLDDALALAFERGLEDVRRWYSQQVGRTFRRSALVEVVGQETVAQYCARLACQPTSDSAPLFRALVDELSQRGHVNRADPDSIYVIAVQTYELSSTMGDPGGAWYTGEGGGVATLGRRELEDIARPCQGDCFARNTALGMLAHELGHALNLPHPHEDLYSQGRDPCDGHCSQTIMWVYSKYPDVSLLDTPEHPEMEALRGSPFFGLKTEAVDLQLGWNLVSLPLRPQPAVPLSVLSALEEDYDVVYGWNAEEESWLSYSPQHSGTLDRLEESMGFWVHAKTAKTFLVVGEPVGPVQIPLVQGWNLIGYPSQRSLPPQEALDSVKGSYDVVYGWNPSDGGAWLTYLPGLSHGTLKEMSPGHAYWIHATRESVLTID
ncbi:MAG: hypothetical protein Q8P22_01650 [Chloroflexota bacterium]|nr:hypothetical protein [Chloroflexota bacterium]